MDLNHIYIDGSKYEANANKYSRVWKKATEKSRYRLFEKIIVLPEEINESLAFSGGRIQTNMEYTPAQLKEIPGRYKQIWKLDEGSFVSGRGHKKTPQQRQYEKLMNEIQCEYDCEIVEVLVSNEQKVEYG